MIRFKFLLVSVVTMLYLFFQTHGADAAKLKKIHFAIPLEYDIHYDPLYGNYVNLQFFFRAIYATLFKLDTDLKPYPFLVSSYERKGKKVIFTLKPNAKFSDGSDITSTAVVASLEAGLKSSAYVNPLYTLIEGGEDLFKGKKAHCTGIKTIDKKRFEIQFVEENVEFETYLSCLVLSILPENRARKILFSGPFMVKSRKDKRKETIFTLQANPWYLGKKPKLDYLILHYYKQHADFEKAIQKGEPDLFLFNRSPSLPKTRAVYYYFKTPTAGGFYFKLNPMKSPFKDKKLRTFFKYFVRSRQFMDSFQWLLTSPADIVLPYSLAGYSIFNPIEPKAFEPFKPDRRITIRCTTPSSGIRKVVFPLLKEKLKTYNINLQLKWDSLNAVNHLEKENQIDLTSIYYVVDVPVSIYFYEILFSPGQELNLSQYEIPEALKLLADYRKERDEIKRMKILSRLEEIAQDEAFVIPFINPISMLGYKEKVKNAAIDRFLNIPFEDIDVE